MGTFGNERAETMSEEALRAQESGRLADQIAYNRQSSPLLASKLDAAGAAPGDIRTVADLAHLPFMEKHEIAGSQADGAILGANQCAPIEDIVRIQGTGGTTGQPMRIG